MFWRIDQEGAKPRGGSAGPSLSSGPQWTEIRTFEGGTLGEQVNLTVGGRSVYSDVEVFAGTRSCRMRALNGETGFGNWGGGIDYPEDLGRGDEVWLRVNTNFPPGFDLHAPGEGGRLKFLRHHTKEADGTHIGYEDMLITTADGIVADATPFKWIYEGENSFVDVGNFASHEIVLDIWETYEWYHRFDNITKDAGGLAVIRWWKNGLLVQEITNRRTLNSPTDKVDWTYIFTYWNGGSPQTQDMYMDNIKLTSIRPSNTDAFGNFLIGV